MTIRRHLSLIIGIAAAVTVLSAGVAYAAITPVPNDASGATTLANALISDASVLTSAGFDAVPGSGTPHGAGDSALTSFPTDGSTFAILTSGDAGLADDPNTSGGSGANLGGGNARGNTDYDVTILRLGLDVPAGANCVTFDFQFLSDEYPEWVGSAFNDAFIAELDSSTWTTSGSTISAPNNFAFDPSGNVVSINSSGPIAMTPANAAGTTYDGATPLLSAATQVSPGAHTLYLSIFDQGDQILDSAVFLDALHVGFVPNPATNCAPGAKVKNFTMQLSPATATNPVGTSHTVTATLTQAGSNAPVPDASISFEVTGANAASGTATTDVNGSASFTYTGTASGSDTITASYDADGDGVLEAVASATKEWVNNPPDCSGVTVSVASLWPPNHKMSEVTLSGATDPDGDPVTITITGVTQDEPLDGLGDGDTAPDAQAGSASNKVLLRAERAGGGDGRVYRIAYAASDGKGGSCSGTVTVGVPHDQRNGGTPVDSGLVVDSFGS